MKKRIIIPAIVMAAATSLSGCQKNPESSIVKNKDLDNMIEQAGNEGNGTKDIGDIAGKYDTYKTDIKDDSLHVNVNVDAKVDIPKTNQMSVLRIKQKTIDQGLLDKVKKELAGDDVLHDGSVLSISTRSDIEKEIKVLKAQIANLSKEKDSYDEDSIKQMKSEYQSLIDALQRQYESAPSEPDWSSFASDGKIQKVEKIYKKNPQNNFYSWEYELNPSGEVYYGVSDGKNGSYTTLFVQNNPDYGNCIRYSRDRHEYAHLTSAVADNSCNVGRWKMEDGFSKDNVLMEVGADDLKEYTDVSATMTQEQAAQTAEKLLGNLGIADFKLHEGGLYGEILTSEADSEGKVGYRKVYVFKYLRNIDGVFVSNDGGSKLTDEWQGDNYVKKIWGAESIEIIINDDGVVGFYYSSPIDVTETVVDKSALKGFDEIQGIFEQMVVVTNAKQDSDNVTVNIDISQAVLRYTRISEQDNFDTGLLVPVWDFQGTIMLSHDGDGGLKDKPQPYTLTINAIDGTVINRELGY